MTKKLLKLIFWLFIGMVSIRGEAQTFVNVGNSYCSPNSVSINSYDTVIFQLIAGSPMHYIESNDGTSFEFSLNSNNPSYKLYDLNAGHYPYHSKSNPAVSGAITVSPGGNESNKYEFIVAPNPFEDHFRLIINPGNKTVTYVKIFDLIGKEVFSIDVNSKSPSIYPLDATNLKPGIYFCTVYSEKGIIETKKIFRTK